MTTAPQLPAESRVRNDDSIPVYPSTGTTGPRRVEVSTLKTKLTDDGFLTDESGTATGIGIIDATVTASAMTNAGGAVATYTLPLDVLGDEPFPAGARALATQFKVTTAFGGDVSAVIQVGDGSDVDRFNTGTPSVFTTGHKDMGVPSGAVFAATATSVVVTITSATDADALIAGGGVGLLRITYMKAPA